MPAGLHTLGSKRYRAHRIKRGCNRSRQTAASNAPRQSSNGRGVEDAAPYGGCETNAAACRVTGTFAPRLPMVRGLCPRDFIRWAENVTVRTASNVGATGHAQRLRLTRPGGHSTTVHRGRCTLRWVRDERCGMLCKWHVCPAPPNGARAVPAGLDALGSGRHRAHRIKHGCNRPRRTDAPNPPRQSRSHGAPRTVHPTGSSVTGLAAYIVTDMENHTQTARPPCGSAKRTHTHTP